MTHVIFDIVSEDPQKPHVPENVLPVAMQEHGSQNRQEIGANRVLRRACESASEVMRDKSVLRNQKCERTGALKVCRNLNQYKYRDIQRNKEIVHYRCAEAGLIVANRKEHTAGSLVGTR